MGNVDGKTPPPIEIFTQEAPDGGFVANVLVRCGATGHGRTEKAAIRLAMASLLETLDALAKDSTPQRIPR